MVVKIRIALDCLYTLQKMIMAETNGDVTDVSIKKSLIAKLEKLAKEMRKEVE